MHGIISKLDGVVNRGHKHTDLIIIDNAKALTRFRTGGYYTNSITMGLESPPISGATTGSLRSTSSIR